LGHRYPDGVVVLGGALVLAAVFWAFYRSERRSGSSANAVTVIVALLVLESALYPDPTGLPTGIFHPQVGNLSFRLFDVLIPLALAARLAVRRPPRALPVALLLWVTFLVWLVCAGVIGLFGANSLTLVAFQAKAILYLGLMALAMDVAPSEWLEGPRPRWLLGASSVVAAVLVVTDQTGVSVTFENPVLPLAGFGAVGTDVATIFATFAVIAVVVGACSSERRMWLLAAAGPLSVAPLVGDQRAALVGLVVSAAAVAVAAPFAWRHMRTTGVEMALAVMAAGCLLLVPVAVSGAMGAPNPRLPLAGTLEQTFLSRGKQLSGEDRINQWTQARGLVAQRPVIGWGLGEQYSYYSPGSFEFVETELTHNIFGDLILRTGLVGLLLFLAAVFATVRDAFLVWVRSAEPLVAALGLACFGALAGMVAKGMVESLFEKYRLAILLGILIGMTSSLSYAVRVGPVPNTEPRRQGTAPPFPLGGAA
jgi:O-antigen ligase